MVTAEHISMEYDLNRGKVRSLKERLLTKVAAPVGEKKFHALRDVSFHLGKGETLGIIGNNGAGKSTLLKIVSGIMKPTEGKIAVSGRISPMIELGTESGCWMKRWMKSLNFRNLRNFGQYR